LKFDELPFYNKFYDPQAEQDKEVRKLWYIYVYHFLTKTNKDWNTALQPNRLTKKTFMFDHITTSDEAITHWFIHIWKPKLQEQCNNGWPHIPRSYGEGEQELKTGLRDYVSMHANIGQAKKSEHGDIACRWNDIFWEEVVANHPGVFNNNLYAKQAIHTQASVHLNDEIIALPDIDDDEAIKEIINKRKLVTTIPNAGQDTPREINITQSIAQSFANSESAIEFLLNDEKDDNHTSSNELNNSDEVDPKIFVHQI
jgi:hypothetical protein